MRNDTCVGRQDAPRARPVGPVGGMHPRPDHRTRPSHKRNELSKHQNDGRTGGTAHRDRWIEEAESVSWTVGRSDKSHLGNVCLMEETTVFFCKMAAAYFFVTGLGFLVSTEFYEKMVRGNASTDPVTLNLSGAVHFLVGLAVVIQHVRWGSPPEIIVTLIGFAAMLKGAALIVVPELTLQLPKTKKAALRMSGVAFTAVGAYLGYVSYF